MDLVTLTWELALLLEPALGSGCWPDWSWLLPGVSSDGVGLRPGVALTWSWLWVRVGSGFELARVRVGSDLSWLGFGAALI